MRTAARVPTGMNAGVRNVPRSSLLVLIDAFVGPRWRELYAAALAHDYRFLSLGDAMLLQRTPGVGSGGAASGRSP